MANKPKREDVEDLLAREDFEELIARDLEARARGGRGGGAPPRGMSRGGPQFGGGRGRGQSRETRRCFRCNQVGHISRDCPQPRNKMFAKIATLAMQEEAGDAIEEDQDASGKV